MVLQSSDGKKYPDGEKQKEKPLIILETRINRNVLMEVSTGHFV